jgi:hypothetical protein
MVMVHFFNKDEQKADIVAFLKKNMTWDVREIVGEKSQLLADKEIIEVFHKHIGTFEKGSKFDEFVKASLLKMIDVADQEKLKETSKMFQILESGYDN